MGNVQLGQLEAESVGNATSRLPCNQDNHFDGMKVMLFTQDHVLIVECHFHSRRLPTYFLLWPRAAVLQGIIKLGSSSYKSPQILSS